MVKFPLHKIRQEVTTRLRFFVFRAEKTKLTLQHRLFREKQQSSPSIRAGVTANSPFFEILFFLHLFSCFVTLERVLWHGDAKETDELGQMGPPMRTVTDRPVGRAERGMVGRPWLGTGMEAAGDATEWAALGSLR